MKAMGPDTRNLLTNILSSLIILMFTYVVASKLMDIKDFRGSLNNQPFDNKFTPFLMVALPVSELLVVALLLFKKTTFYGFLLSTILMSIFTVYIGLVLGRYYDRIPCSCGGITSQMSWIQHLYFNTFFIIVSAIGVILTVNHRISGSIRSIRFWPYRNMQQRQIANVTHRKK